MIKKVELLTSAKAAMEEKASEVLYRNVEQFRVDTFKVLQAYTSHDREVIKALNSKLKEDDYFFQCWHDEIRMPLRSLRRPVSATLLRTLSNTLAYNDRESGELAEVLIEKRTNELMEKLIHKVYGDAHRKSQYAAVMRVLSWSEHDIEVLYMRYIEWKAYVEVAKANHISIYDPYASWAKRRIVSIRIKKENKKLLQSENEKIERISQHLKALCAQNDELINHIKATNIDIVTIIAAKAEYEKRLQKIPEAKRLNPVIRTDIYTQVTASLRETFGEGYKQRQIDTLAGSREIVNDIDTVLMRVFDLSNFKKNQLMADMKVVRELLREKDAIRSTQSDRIKVSKRTLWH